jgi:hypothetical protein
MAKQSFQPNNRVKQIFDDLEFYKEFCVDYGYKYDEATLYDMRSYVFRQFNKAMTGKPAKNSWDEDARRLNA